MIPTRFRPLNGLALLGAVAMTAYGTLAIVFPYPRITEPAFEIVWTVANLGVIAAIVSWTAMSQARPRPLAVTGAVIAITGHVLRIVLGVWSMITPGADVDGLIPLSIPLMFLGMILLGIATLIGRGARDWRAWTPLVTVVAGFVASTLYSVDLALHFIVLGTLWGLSWLILALALPGIRREPGNPRRSRDLGQRGARPVEAIL